MEWKKYPGFTLLLFVEIIVLLALIILIILQRYFGLYITIPSFGFSLSFSELITATISILSLTVSIFAVWYAKNQVAIAKLEYQERQKEKEKQRLNIKVLNAIKQEIQHEGLRVWALKLLIHNNSAETILISGLVVTFEFTQYRPPSNNYFKKIFLYSGTTTLEFTKNYFGFGETNEESSSDSTESSFYSGFRKIFKSANLCLISNRALHKSTIFYDLETKKTERPEEIIKTKRLEPQDKQLLLLAGKVPGSVRACCIDNDLYLSSVTCTYRTDQGEVTIVGTYSAYSSLDHSTLNLLENLPLPSNNEEN